VSIGAIVLREGKGPFIHRDCATADRQRCLQHDALASKLEVGPIDHDDGLFRSTKECPGDRSIDLKALTMQVGISQEAVDGLNLVLFASVTAQVASKMGE
jgi:hypothetical protein